VVSVLVRVGIDDVKGSAPSRAGETLEVLPTVRERVEGIVVGVEPESWFVEAGTAAEDSTVDLSRSRALITEPPSDEVQHAVEAIRVFTGIGDGQRATARLSADHQAMGVNIESSQEVLLRFGHEMDIRGRESALSKAMPATPGW
jgi:hypothetical protein